MRRITIRRSECSAYCFRSQDLASAETGSDVPLICFVDPDIEATAKKIEATGGKVRSKIWKLFPDKPYKIVYCEDPFGNTFELYTHSTEQIWSNQ